MTKNFGLLVREIRLDLNMVQVEFSKAIGVNQGSLSKIEKGESTTNMEVLVKLCHFIRDKPVHRKKIITFLFD